MFYFLFIFSLSFCLDLTVPAPLFSVGNKVWFDVDFYEDVFKDDWVGLSVEKKEEAFQDFISRELVCFLAQQQGFDRGPKIQKDLDLRKRALLINNTYEHTIARPLISQADIAINKKNLKYKVQAYHLLIGFSGSDQDTGALLSQQQALSLIDSLRVEINKEVSSSNADIIEVFSRFAVDFSVDPSVQNNLGFLGWVPWGQTVMSFQKPLFDLKTKVVSDPILTQFGYHLALKTDLSFSNYFYYKPKHYIDLTSKISQSRLSFDTLKALSANFDSLLIQSAALHFNPVCLDSLVLFLENKQKQEKLLGNKNVLLSWLDGWTYKNVLFTVNKKGFGVLWLINQLQKMPSSRIPQIKTKKDIQDLVLSFILQEKVLWFAQENKIDTTVSFLRDWSNHYKNIIYSEYLSFLNSSVSKIDSSTVLLEYNKGLYNNKYIKPRRAVFTEVRVFGDSLGLVLKESKQQGVSFDSLLVLYGGGIKEPVSGGAKSPLGQAVFLLSQGEVSSVIENKNGSFSVVRLESFLPEEPFSLSFVYSQIEQKKRREKQDSVRINLFENLLKDLRPEIHYNVLGLIE